MTRPRVVTAFFLAFAALFTGVMAEEIDSDLVGVVVAAACVGILAIVIVAFMVYCCVRRQSEWDRNSVLGRKDSRGSASTSVTPRWAPTMVPTPVSAMPVYSVPEPYIYAVPPHNYYLGGYTPKFIDAERLQYVRHHHHRAVYENDPNRSPSLHLEQASQPNGHVHDFSASSVNYRVIRKHHKHEKMPDWLRKSYGENERSLEIGEEGAGSRESSVRSNDNNKRRKGKPSPPKSPPDADVARAQVSPRMSRVESRDVLHVAHDFTIVDYVDPEGRAPVPRGGKGGGRSSGSGVASPTSSSSPSRQQRGGDGYAEYRITTTTVTDTSVQGRNVSHASSYVPPASTSTPRYPPTNAALMSGDDGDDEREGEETSFERQRRPGDGSVKVLPRSGSGGDNRHGVDMLF